MRGPRASGRLAVSVVSVMLVMTSPVVAASNNDVTTTVALADREECSPTCGRTKAHTGKTEYKDTVRGYVPQKDEPVSAASILVPVSAVGL